MTGLRETIGKPVVDRGSAEQLGQLRAPVVDAGSRRVVKLVVARGRQVSVVEWARVVSLGPDAVIVEAARQPRDDEDREVAGALDPLGKRVLSDEGNELGQIVDVTIDDGGTVQDLSIADATIAGERLLGVGSYAVVIAHDTA